jgi:hypothetical protein
LMEGTKQSMIVSSLIFLSCVNTLEKLSIVGHI